MWTMLAVLLMQTAEHSCSPHVLFPGTVRSILCMTYSFNARGFTKNILSVWELQPFSYFPHFKIN